MLGLPILHHITPLALHPHALAHATRHDATCTTAATDDVFLFNPEEQDKKGVQRREYVAGESIEVEGQKLGHVQEGCHSSCGVHGFVSFMHGDT